MNEGDRLTLHVDTAGPRPPDEGIRIVHEDDELVAISKESGILVHPVRLMTRDTVVGYLRPRFPGIRLCHRLDKLTSGLLLLARTGDAARFVQTAFAAGAVRKRYLALVEGRPERDSGVMDGRIGPDRSSPVHIKMRVDPAGEPCETAFRVLERFEDCSFLELTPGTGRKHQIRVHLAHAGHPILGDFLYGRQIDVDYFENKKVNVTRDTERWLALHAESLELEYPGRGGRPLSFRAPLAVRFQALLDDLRRGGSWRSQPPV